MFSIVTSAFFSSSFTISRPRGDLRLRVTDFLLALNWWKYQGSSSGWPGRSRRPGSPVFGFSILTTSAPSQASASVHDGPASTWVKSTTRTPARQSSSTPSVAAIAHTPPVKIPVVSIARRIKPRKPVRRRPRRIARKRSLGHSPHEMLQGAGNADYPAHRGVSRRSDGMAARYSCPSRTRVRRTANLRPRRTKTRRVRLRGVPRYRQDRCRRPVAGRQFGALDRPAGRYGLPANRGGDQPFLSFAERRAHARVRA